jgi:hypothetical protein
MISAALLSVPGGATAGLQLGVAAVKINPPPGIGLAGYYHARTNDGVLDDLHARAMVMDDGQTRAGIVVCDLIGMPRWIVEEARQRIEEQVGIPGGNLMIAATHTHTAPVVYREWSRDDADGAATPVSVQYSKSLPERIAEAVAEAKSKLQPVRWYAGRENEEKLAHNRRWWMRDGSVGWNPGKLNPELLRPAGPIDPQVGVLYAASESDAAVLTFVNYAMHPDTTGGTRLSADYPGALARTLALYKGPDMLTLFANGTCGNLNHVDFRWGAPQSSAAEANRLGVILAAAVFKAYPALELLPNDLRLRVSVEKVRLPLPDVTAAEVAQARMDARTARDNTREGFMKLVRAHRVLDVAAREGRPEEVEVQVIAAGAELAWVSWPGEVFVELGLSVKAGSPFRHTYNVELANGTIGYIPNKSAWPEGNYEVESARVAAGAGEMLVTSALRQMSELAR